MSHVHFLAEDTCCITSEAPTEPTISIAIIDDYVELLEIASKILSCEGYCTLPFTNPTSALEYIRKGNEVDLVICDIIMPGLSGFQVADAVRLHSPRVPVLYLTGDSLMASEVRTNGEPNTAVLQKPFQMRELIASVSSLLGKNRSHRSSRKIPCHRTADRNKVNARRIRAS